MAVGIVEMIFPMLGKPIANGLKVFQMIAKSGILIIEPRTRFGAGSSPERGPTITATITAGSIPKLPIIYQSLFFAFIFLNKREKRRKYAKMDPTRTVTG